METTKTLQTIIRKLTGEKKTRNLGSLLKKSVEVAPQDYKKLNYERRTDVQRATLDSVIDAIEKDAAEELNEEAKDSLEHLPKIEQKAEDIDDESEESRIIQAFQDVEMDGSYVKYDDPWDPLSTILKMSFSDRILYSYLKVRFGLRDQRDYDQIKKSYFGPLHHVLSESLGERFKDTLYLLVFQLSRLYGVPPVKKLKPTDVYTGGYPFYRGHEGESTITFSTSSGLPNPLERFGTDEFAHKYSVPDHDTGDLLLKNPYRMDNFAKGILNRDIDCKRLYVWEKEGTSKALKRALDVVPINKRQEFLNEAVKLLAEAFVFDRIRIIQLDEFDRWMRRFTRNAKGEIMFSLRGRESKRISEAIQVNFDLDAMRGQREDLQRALIFASIMLRIAGHPAVDAVMGLVLGDAVLYSLVESTLRRPIDSEREITEIGRVIKDYGALEQRQAHSQAEEVIEELLR